MFTEEGSGVASGYTGYVGAYGPGQLGGRRAEGKILIETREQI